MASGSIKNVIVIGPSGSVGPYIVEALLAHHFSVSVLTRASSGKSFASNIRVHYTDYSTSSLLKAFEGQDAVVSTIATLHTDQQTSMIDAAIAAGVKHFIPSEFGIDTSSNTIYQVIPVAVGKHDTVDYLRSKESIGVSWTAICVGAFFDWVFQYPGLMGWDLPGRKATIYDDGNFEYEATNVKQIGRAVAAALSPEHFEETRNKYIYVNSFTTTQNNVLAELEKATGSTFEITYQKTEDLHGIGLAKLTEEKGTVSSGGGQYAAGAVETITSAIYGYGRLNEFSKTRGLWNEQLGLPKETIEKTVESIVGAE